MRRSDHLVSIATTLSLCAHLFAQSAIKTWGRQSSDTRIHDDAVAFAFAARDSTAIVMADGRLYLGGQSVAVMEVPTLAPMAVWRHVAMSFYLAAGVTSSGEIVAWGTTSTGVPVLPSPSLPSGVFFTSVEAGDAHLIALRSDGTVVAWGNNTYGQCNIQQPAGVGAVQVAATLGMSYALLSNGHVITAGLPQAGENLVPPLPAGLSYLSVASGGLHAMAVRSDGQLIAWGDNQLGQCNVPPLPFGMTYILAAGGLSHSIALRSDGSLVTWGAPDFGLSQPPPLLPGEYVLSLRCGNNHTVALLSSGRVMAWGNNSFEQAYVPTRPPQQRHVLAAAGYNNTGALLSDGSIQLWGEDLYGQSTLPSSLVGYSWRRLECGWVHTGALRDDGQLFLWGDNIWGKCNVPVLPLGLTYTDFELSGAHSVALRSDGTAVAIGHNGFGECNIPPPPAGVRYVDLDVEYSKTLLLRSDGALTYVGSSSSGNANIPVLPVGLTYTGIAAARNFNAAIRSDGSLVTWGSTPSAGWPTPLPGMPFGIYPVEINAGYDHVVIRRSDGNIVSFGYALPVPPLEPGTSYVQVAADDDNVTARVGPTSTYISYAQGCAGSRPRTKLVPSDTPRLGGALDVRFFDLPQNLMVLAFGWQATPAVSLAPIGMPNCFARVSLDALVAIAGQNNQAVWTLNIPDVPAALGVRFYNQAFVFDAGANPMGAVVSDAAEGVIGDK